MMKPESNPRINSYSCLNSQTDVYVWQYLTWQQSVTTSYFSLCSVPSGAPSNVVIRQRSRNKLLISWTALPKRSWNGQRRVYQVCCSRISKSSNPTCFSGENTQSTIAVIKNLQPATKYFVTVAAGTSAGYGPKSTEVSGITRDGGN